MKVFIHSHYYLPATRAGAEIFLHEIAKYFLAEGHEVIATVNDDITYNYEGISIRTNRYDVQQYYWWADCIITHLEHASLAIEQGQANRKPVFHLLHNNSPAHLLRNPIPDNYIIYNSYALQHELHLPHKSIVGRPVTFLEDWRTDIDHYMCEYITLVNCCYEKGGGFLLDLALGSPEFRFLGVRGSYNDQIIEVARNRNIQYLPQQKFMRLVYDQTQIIIIPSNYESWSMTAAEAMASGIPVICTDTPGLRENCGAAAIYIKDRTIRAYREAIYSLQARLYYEERSHAGLVQYRPNDLDYIYSFICENTPILKEKEEQSQQKEKKIIEDRKEKQSSEHPPLLRDKSGRWLKKKKK
jgi:glycosyltransferase involved in cell wall biosynthesis